LLPAAADDEADHLVGDRDHLAGVFKK
jgi:hypothetical protein